MTMWGWRRFLVDYILGYDFFISYSRKDGGQYPRRLHERLQAEFAVRTFLDSGEEGFLAGDELAGETRRRVRASSCLLLVARPFALQSVWVRAEIESAVTAGRRLVIVDLNEALMSMPDSHPMKPLLGDRIYLSETVLGGDGEPETATLESLARAVRGARREARRLRVISTIALFLVLLLIVTGVLYVSAVRARRQAEWRQRLSESGLLAEHSRANILAHPQRSLLLAMESIALLRNGTNDLASYNPVEALQEALLAVGGSRALHCGKRPCWFVSFSPDGKSLATGNEDGTVSLWSLARPEHPRKVWQGRGSPVRVLRFSRDGSRLATAGLDGRVTLWPAAGQSSEAVVLRGHGGKISSLEFTLDGQHLVTGGSDGRILSWDLAKERLLPLTIGSHGAVVSQMALSPDGLWLASGGDDGEVRAWRLGGDGRESRVVAKHGEPVAAVSFSPDGGWLATGGQDGKGFLIPWPPSASRPRIALELAPFGVEFVSLSFSPDSRLLATTSTLPDIYLWTLGKHVALGRAFTGARNGNSPPAFSPDGSFLAVGGDDGILRVWSLEFGNSPPRLLRGPEGGIDVSFFSPDQRWIAAGGEDASARLWSWSGQAEVPQRMRSGPPGTSQTAFSPDGSWVASAGNEGVSLGATRDRGLAAWRLDREEAFLPEIKFSPDSRALAVGTNRRLRLWMIDEDKPAAVEIPVRPRTSSSFSFSMDGKLLAIEAETGALWLCELPSGNCRMRPAVSEPRATMVSAFDPALRIFACGQRDGSLRFGQLAASSAGYVVSKDHAAAIYRLIFSPDGKWLASLDERQKLCLHAAARGWLASKCTTSPGSRGEQLLSFSPDGEWLVAAESSFGSETIGNAWLWSARDGWSSARALRGHDGQILSLAFDPMGRWLATGGWDLTVRLWPLWRDDLQPRVLRGFNLPVRTLAFDPNATHLNAVTGSNDVTIWPLAIDDLINAGCASAGRNLTADERHTYLGTLDQRAACKQP